MKKLLGILVLGLLLISNIAESKSNISKKKFYSKIEENGNAGFVLRYHNEKSCVSLGARSPQKVSLPFLYSHSSKTCFANPTLHHNKPRTKIPKSFFISLF